MGKSRDIAPGGGRAVGATSSSAEIEAFLQAAREIAPAAGRGRLVFALDATMSRQPTWDLACRLQAGMFDAAGATGRLAVQLVYFRGMGECRASPWVVNAAALRDLMLKIDCRGGETQIRKVLAHVRRENARQPVAALVYVGDSMEEEADRLCALAGEIGLLGVRAFIFHEGHDPDAARTFREVARLTKGAYLPFDASSAARLRELLGAVATYAAGGLQALTDSKSEGARLLLPLLK